MKKFIALSAIALACAISAVAKPFDLWSKYRVISINTTNTGGGANVTAAVNDIPVLVRLTNASAATGSDILAEALAGGADLRVTDSTGRTSLPLEIESWSASAATIWVRVPTVDANSITKLRFYWGRAGQTSASNSAAVFSSSNGYVGVWHMGNPTGGDFVAGVRPNAKNPGTNDATPANLPTGWAAAPTGIIGAADTVPGTGTLRLGTASGFTLGTLPVGTFPDSNATFSGWIAFGNPTSNVYRSFLTAASDTSFVNQNCIAVGAAGTSGTSGNSRLGYQTAATGNVSWPSTASGSWTQNTWLHVSMSWRNGITNNDSIYKDGSYLAFSGNAGSEAVLTNVNRTLNFIGRNFAPTDAAFLGKLDEIRMSNVARNRHWTKLEYETQKPAATAVTLGTSTANQDTALTAAAYATTAGSYPAGFAITPNLLTVTGSIDTVTIAPALPAGLTLDVSTGTIYGRPTTVQAATAYVITVKNDLGQVTANITIAVTAAAPANLVYPTQAPILTVGTVSAANTPTVDGSGLTFAVTPALPAGLAISTTTGAITGTPTDTSSAKEYVVTVTNGSGNTKDTVSITVRPALPTAITYAPDTLTFFNNVAISPAKLPSITVVAPKVMDSIKVTTGTLPAGITFNILTGEIAGTPTATTTGTNLTLTYYNASGTTTKAIRIVVSPGVTSLLYRADSSVYEGGLPIEANVPVVSAGSLVSSYTIAPALPSGLTLNASTGFISGRAPTTASALTSYIVTATNPAGSAADTIRIQVVAAEDYTTWTTTKTLNLNTSAASAGVATAQSRFPVLVRLTAAHSAIFAAAKGDGSDIRFSLTDGTRLPYDIDRWDSAGKKAEVWVELPTVTSSGTTAIRMHYGKSGVASKSSGYRVFNVDNGYVGVWHLGNAAGIDPRPSAVVGAPPATPSNNFTGAQFGGGAGVYVAPEGAIGKADTVRGTGTRATPTATSDFLNIGNVSDSSVNSYRGRNTYTGYSDFTGGYTYSLWVNPSAHVNFTYLASLANLENGNDNIQVFRPDVSGAVRFEQLNNTSSGGTLTTPGNQILTGFWRNVTITVTPSGVNATNTVNVYLNGALVVTGNSNQAPRNVVRTNAWIGKSNYTGDSYFAGSYDEPRYSKLPRSADWTKLEYKNQKPGVTPVLDLTYSTPTATYTTGTAITPNTATVTGAATRYSVSPALPAGLVFNDTTGVISGTPTAAAAAASYAITAYGDSSWSTATSVSITVTGGLALPVISYSPATVVDSTTKAASHAVTSSGGAVASYSIAPALPAGLTLNTTTGLISGTPTAVTTATNYTVTATNATGSATTVINIATPLKPTAILPGAFVFRVNGSDKPYTFQLPENTTTEKLTLSITDAWGRTVWSKSINPARDQIREISWNGKSSNGRTASAGMYVVKITVFNGGKSSEFIRKSVSLSPR